MFKNCVFYFRRLIAVFLIIFLKSFEDVTSKNLNCQYNEVTRTYNCHIYNINQNESLDSIWEISSDNHKQNTSSVGIYESTVLYLSNEIFLQFPSLEELIIRGVSLKEMHVKSFEGAKSLKTFRAELNHLRKVKNSTFVNAKNLLAISLRGNYIEYIEENAFEGLNLLKKLSLGQNSIKKLPVHLLRNTPTLEILFLNNNQIKVFNLNLFKNTKQLKWLFIEQNKLEVIKGSTKHIKNLKIANFLENICIDKYFEGQNVSNQLENHLKSCKTRLQDSYNSCQTKKQEIEELIQVERDTCNQQVSRLNFARQVLNDQLKNLLRRANECEEDYEIFGFLAR